MTFDLEPDLDNANVGMLIRGRMGGFQTGNFPFLYFGGKVMVKINGASLDLAGKTLMEYLETTAYDVRRIAVERNGEIVPKAKYPEVVLMDGDTLEVVSFVGGG